MKKVLNGILIAAAVVTTGSAAHAADGKYVAGDLAKAYMTYTTIDQVPTSRTSAYNGVGSLFVSTASTATTGFGSLCTGSLIGSRTVLTAAHCLSGGANDPVTSINFYLPSFGDRRTAGAQVFTAVSFAINPSYATTGLAGGNDIAAFTITGDTSRYDKYGLFLGDPFQVYTEVGTGTIGGPQGSNIGVTNDYRKRVGTNVYEYYGSDVFTDSTKGVVLYDFDDGTAAHDVFGRAGGNVQQGIPGESSASPGDSGGPEFINGQIASVTSFGITGGIFDGFCGGTSNDPYDNTGSTAVQTDLSKCTNSSVGEIGGNTLVSYNIDFVRNYLTASEAAGAVPEPAAWAMMIFGFGVVGGTLRRRRTMSLAAGV